MKLIDTSAERDRFTEHLKINKRTILSAKFGDGKTSFLDEYKSQHNDDVVFVTLYPVNYSVATNEDIFEYIKYDILLQLAKAGYVCDIDVEAFIDSIAAWENLKEVIGFLLSCIPGGSIYKKILEKGENVIQKFNENKTTIDKYSKAFKYQRGGLYEDDGYTKLIKCAIENIHNGNDSRKKEAVLIIEDLDRIDPAHLFRILNVFGAHLDIDKKTNKFGFDNIIFVLDYNKTKYIYEHFYGQQADYQGYMSKFMSCYEFNYSISKIAKDHIYNYLELINIDKSTIKDVFLNNSHTSFSEYIDKLNVRTIANAIDGLDKQYKKVEYEIRKGVIINTDNAILKFLSLCKRLGINVDINYFAGELTKKMHVQGLNMIGDFMRISPYLHTGICFNLNGKQVGIGEDCKRLVFIEGGGGYLLSSEAEIKHIVLSALLESSKFVSDIEII